MKRLFVISKSGNAVLSDKIQLFYYFGKIYALLLKKGFQNLTQ
ncbi:hypothetical protein [Hugenholtzia roseola]|nr:hypothetical protein [Hugenholtzia roseola]